MRKITDDEMLMIGSYMNDEIREKVHNELAPCTPRKFLKRYLKLDPDFAEILRCEFGIVL